jgi:hypothetical protein
MVGEDLGVGVSELPKWPDHVPNKNDDWEDMTSACEEYERARAEAAIARLRVAVEALDRISISAIHRADIASNALAAIGPLP